LIIDYILKSHPAHQQSPEPSIGTPSSSEGPKTTHSVPDVVGSNILAPESPLPAFHHKLSSKSIQSLNSQEQHQQYSTPDFNPGPKRGEVFSLDLRHEVGAELPQRTRGDGVSLLDNTRSSILSQQYGSLGRPTKLQKMKKKEIREESTAAQYDLATEAKPRNINLEEIKKLLSQIPDEGSPRSTQLQIQNLLRLGPEESICSMLQDTVIDQSMDINAFKQQRLEIMNPTSKESLENSQSSGCVKKRSIESTKSMPIITDERDSLGNGSNDSYHEFEIQEQSEHSLDDTIRLSPYMSMNPVEEHEEENNKNTNYMASLCDTTMTMEVSQNTCTSVCTRNEVVVEGCVQGIVTWLSIPIDNPSNSYIKILARIDQESLNGVTTDHSSVVYKEECMVPPCGGIVWALGVCGRNLGALKCILKLKLIDFNSGNSLVTNFVPIVATINRPQVVIGNREERDHNIGIIPEAALHSTHIDVTNESERDLAVMISFTQPSTIFQFTESENIRSVSDSEISCILTPGLNRFYHTLQAPQLVADSSSLKVTATISVKIDSPQLPRPCLASKEISATVEAIIVNIPRSCFPLNLSVSSNAPSSVRFTLANLSAIPIQITIDIDITEGSRSIGLFDVVPKTPNIAANSSVNPVILFKPNNLNSVPLSSFKAVVRITVETNGLEYSIPLKAKCTDELHSMNTKSNPQKSVLDSKYPEADQRRPFIHIEASKSMVMFPVLPTNTSVSQKLSFNNMNDYSITMVFAVSSQTNGFTTDTDVMVVPAKGVGQLTVTFTPTDCLDYAALLVCKTKGLPQRYKYSIPLQGYGGGGVLSLVDKVVSFPVTPRDNSSIVRLTLGNTGSRAICTVVTSSVSPDCLTVQPREVVITPGSSQDVLLVWSNGRHHTQGK